MQLWKTSAERMPVKSRHSHSGKHHGYDANCAVFFQTCQPTTNLTTSLTALSLLTKRVQIPKIELEIELD